MRAAPLACLLLLGCTAAPAASGPVPFEARGRLVCLLEEMKRDHGAETAPAHEHVLGFRVEEKDPPRGLRYHTILRTRLSMALFVDPRFRERELRLRGRVFPGSAVLEVTRFQWYRDGRLHDVFYWCEVCTIRDVDPGLCACCQAAVEFRETPSPEGP